MAVMIPDKHYFKIGEVSTLLDLKPYVLRYWETEFDILNPTKAKSRHRLYRRKDVELLLEIKRLLHGEGYTIEGARKKLKQGEAGDHRTREKPDHRRELVQIRDELVSLRDLIS